VALTPGSRLGSYEIGPQIGVGGMGEVYRATDTNLGRQVAIKVLPDAVAQDAERLARFDREARTLAALNHPNIAAIYGLERFGGQTALVMELVEGETLAERIEHGALSPDEALRFALQIAAALEAAHDKGVIHRDLKPANIKVTSEGTVKVLDFGLAKAFDAQAGSDAAVTHSPTLSMAATQQGIILGTAAYMSPEQAKGRATDKRTDIWAFGAVLFEMLTGRPVFQAEDVSTILARVLDREPDFGALPERLHPRLRDILERCLQKDVRQRYHDMADVRLDIEGVLADAAGLIVRPVMTGTLGAPPSKIPWVAAIVVASVVTGVAVSIFLRPDVVPVDLVRFTVPTAPLDGSGQFRDLAISPDGTKLAYVAAGTERLVGQIYIRSLDQLVATPLSGAQGTDPFFSPDGEWVLFTSSFGRTLQKVPVSGGPPVPLTQSGSIISGASWGSDDEIVFGLDGGGLFRVSAEGGEPEPLTTLDTEQGESGHLRPFVIPGREAVLFCISVGPPLQSGQLAALDLSTGEVKRLGLAGVSPRYISTGHLVYAAADGWVRAVPFDVTSLEITGTPVPLLDGVGVKVSGAADFDTSDNGGLAYVLGTPGGAQRSLAWVDRNGREEPIPAPPRAYTYLRFSPDGTRVAIDVRDQENDIWIWDFVRFSRLTFDPAADQWPVWTPDGRRVLFGSSRGASVRNIYETSAAGTGEVTRLTTSATDQVPYSVSPDEMSLLLFENINNSDVSVLSLQGQATSEPLLHSSFSERNAELSPDGRWVAFDSDESGQPEVFVRPFPEVTADKQQVSTSGGEGPVWSRDGKELYYAQRPGRIMVVPVDADDAVTFGDPALLMEYSSAFSSFGRSYDVSPDGQRFLVIKTSAADTSDEDTNAEIRVVLHWFEELSSRVPTD